MDYTALTEALRQLHFDRGNETRSAVGDDQQWWPQSPGLQARQEVAPGVGRFGGGRLEGNQAGTPIGVDAPGNEHRLGSGVLVHLEVGAV